MLQGHILFCCKQKDVIVLTWGVQLHQELAAT